MNEEYSPFKMVHYRQKLIDYRAGKEVWPVSIQIDLTSQCNLNCSFCISNTLNIPNSSLNINQLVDYINLLHSRGLEAIELTGGGEPLLYQHCHKLIEHIKKLSLQYSIVTNGTYLHKYLDLIEDVSWVRVSLDSATAETYQDIKDCDKFKLVTNNISKLVDVLSTQSILGLSFVVTKQNWHEMYDFCKLALELNVDNVRITPEVPSNNSFNQEMIELFKQCKSLETDEFRVFGQLERFNYEQLPNLSYCWYSVLQKSIGCDGNIYPCCTRRYRTDSIQGTIDNHSYYNTISLDRCPVTCVMKQKNKFGEYISISNPRHKEFI